MLLTIFHNRSSAIWVLLIAATLLSWWLGAGHGIRSREQASVIVILVAFIKVRFVGLYFMELRDAPRALRAIFEAYCVVVCAALIGMFLSAHV